MPLRARARASPVQRLPARAAPAHNTGLAQHAQLLTGCRLGERRHAGEFSDRKLAIFEQRTHEPQPAWVGEEPVRGYEPFDRD